MDANEVFILLRTPEHDVETRFVGHLYLERDAAGAISEMLVEEPEMYRASHEIYFDHDDYESPEFPMMFWHDHEEFRFATYSSDLSVQSVLFEDEKDRSRFRDIYLAALRMAERVRRGEPVMVGYTELEQHASEWSGDLWPSAPRDLGPARRRKFIESERKPVDEGDLREVSLRPVENDSDIEWPSLTLQMKLTAAGFPSRKTAIYGSVNHWKFDEPFRIDPRGTLRGALQALGLDSVTTNLFARRIGVDELVAVWSHDFLHRANYEISLR